MATQLGLYNGALLTLGEAKLATISDAVEARYVLDERYDQAKADCLEAGQWNFAIRTASATEDATSPDFGWAYQFTKPTDWVRTAMVASDETFTVPLVRFEDETGFWKADITPLYVKYVSNHATFGGGLLSAWPSSFTRYVELYLAELCCLRITGDKGLFDRLHDRDVPKAKKAALSRDAMNGPPRFPPPGSWVRSRMSSIHRGRYDRA